MIKKTEALLELLRSDYQEILRENLVGIYLHGSYVLGSYQEKVSDLDYLVVVYKKLSIAVKKDLMNYTLATLWPLAPKKGLEFHVLCLVDTLAGNYPLPFDFHFSPQHLRAYADEPELYLKNMQGLDPDLAAHVQVTYLLGKVLVGAEIPKVFAPVPEKDYWQSVLGDVQDAEKEIVQKPTYFVLNLCRALAYRQEHQILSKKAGGKWGLSHLSTAYRPTILLALAAYDGLTVKNEQYTTATLINFAQEVIYLLQ